MWSKIVGSVIGPLAGIGKQWMQNKAAENQAKHDRRLTVIKGEINWDEQAMLNAQSSWKDEYLLVIFSIPLVGAFIPDLVPHMMAGFEALDKMPEWYQYAISGMVAASFGIRGMVGWNKSKDARKIIDTKAEKERDQ
jgi:hypothetical protein